jgi:hypothetical protein
MARERIKEAQESQREQYDATHRPPPTYLPGENAWLSGKGISWPVDAQRPAGLQDEWLGPFPVISQDGLNVKLSLPPSLSRVHPEFHVEKLTPSKPNDASQFPGREIPERPTGTITEQGTEFEIEKILDHRTRQGKKQYLVKFRGHPFQDAEWHDYSHEDPTWDADRPLVVEYERNPVVHVQRSLGKRVDAAKAKRAALGTDATNPVQGSSRMTRSKTREQEVKSVKIWGSCDNCEILDL